MVVASYSKADKIVVGKTCVIYEYPYLGTDKTNGAVAEINGRYPEHGWAINHVSDEMVYVLEGQRSDLASR